MTAFLRKCLRGFRRDERGSMTVEFALWFPFFIVFLFASIEMGIITARHAMLERGLDLAVRQVRLGTGNPPQHDELKAMICEKAAIIPDCETNLRLEMRPTSMRNWTSIPDAPDCTDRSEPVTPVREYRPGLQNQMMLLRACVKMTPLMPTSKLVERMARDGSGDIAMIVTNAFVQEPE